MEKIRLDLLLVEKGLVDSRSLAQRMVMAGQVRVNGEVILKPSVRIANSATLSVDQGPLYVSRGGEKLAAALAGFGLEDMSGLVCADIGASTGGFTDCLLQHGAEHVFAVDVGYGELHWRLRNDPRVSVMERTNARNVAGFTQNIDLVTVDASFISLRILLPVIHSWFTAGTGKVLALIKPQFEAGRADAARGEGVIRDPEIHRQVLLTILEAARVEGFGIQGLIRSPLIGPKGNVEFLVYLVIPPDLILQAADLVGDVVVSS